MQPGRGVMYHARTNVAILSQKAKELSAMSY